VTPLHVLSVVPEIYPLVKTGGLADVAGALPLALEAEGVRTTSVVPAYPAVRAAIGEPDAEYGAADLFGGSVRLLRKTVAGLDVLAVDAPHLFDRPGNPYVGPDGRDWDDNPLRFAALARVAADIATGSVPDLHPDILHAHDWQTGLAPAYLSYRGGPRPGTVMTIHNLAFQGQVPPGLLGVLGLPPEAFSIAGVEYYGAVGYLKAGLAMADRITTVSPSYAAEIATVEGGMGMYGLLRNRAHVLTGILNGIDDAVWDPATDTLIAAPFSASRLPRRGLNKAALQARFGLHASPETLVLGVISRLTWQKGLDLLLEALPHLLALDTQLVVLGSGDRALEAAFVDAASAHPGRVGCVIGYNEPLAHQIQAGSDALLVPSRFEPCGLTQLCALRYGAVPVVARVGGLSDSIIDANEAALAAGTGSGVQFAPVTTEMLEAALLRVAALWRDQPTWRKIQRNAMKTDVSWRRPAARYAALYRGLIAERGA
jgi:starch synthase